MAIIQGSALYQQVRQEFDEACEAASKATINSLGSTCILLISMIAAVVF